MKFLEPEHRVADQEIPDLIAAEVENQGAPVGVLALTGIGMFVERGAVEPRETMGVFRKVRRNPVDDDPDAALVAAIHKFTKLIRRAEATGRGKVTANLIAPGFVVGKLRHRHEFNMGVAHFFDVIDKLIGEFEIGEETIFLLKAALPRAEMHLIDRHRTVVGVGLSAFLHPRLVFPEVTVEIVGDTGSLGAVLGEEGAGIAFDEKIALGSNDLKFVVLACRDARNEDLPDAVVVPHRMNAAVPDVEVTDDTDAVRVRCPDREGHSRNSADLREMGPHAVVEVTMISLTEEVEILFAEDGAE